MFLNSMPRENEVDANEDDGKKKKNQLRNHQQQKRKLSILMKVHTQKRRRPYAPRHDKLISFQKPIWFCEMKATCLNAITRKSKMEK